jgi:hypothetical protein
MEKGKRNLIDRDELIDSLGTSDMEIFAKEVISDAPIVDAKPAVHAKWQKQWCDSSMIGHMYEECPICGCMILDTEKFWDCRFCPNCGTEMLEDTK